jgi:chromosome segregation ATPase
VNIVEAFQGLLAKFTGVAERLEQSIAENKQSASVIEAKDTEIASLKSQLESAPKLEAITELSDKVTALEAEKVTLKAEVASLPQQVNTKAAEIVAANGHAPVPTAGINDSKPRIESIMEEIRAETNPIKRTQLYDKHKEEIKKARLG